MRGFISKGRIGLVVLPILTGCGGSVPVSSALQQRNCDRAAQIAAAGTPAASLEFGAVRPPLPDGLKDPRGVILDPQASPGRTPPEAPTVGVPDPERRKLVVVGSTDLTAETLRRRFDGALGRHGLRADGNKQEARVGGQLSEFTFTFGGPGVEGTAKLLRCRPSSLVVVSQTLTS